jgi:hypothetical protein
VTTQVPVSFRKNLTEIQTPSSHEKFFPKPNLFWPAQHSVGDICHIYQAPVQLTAQKQTNSRASSTLRAIKKQMSDKSMSEQLTLGNYASTQLWEGWLAQLPGSSVSQSSASCVAIALSLPQFALLHSVPRVQLSLLTILVDCGCQFPLCVLALTLFYFYIQIKVSLICRLRCHTILGVMPAVATTSSTSHAGPLNGDQTKRSTMLLVAGYRFTNSTP